jgi:hypothetical protein
VVGGVVKWFARVVWVRELIELIRCVGTVLLTREFYNLIIK